jgi:hypothetical protein
VFGALALDEHQSRQTRLIRLLLRQGAAGVCPQSLGALAGRPIRASSATVAGRSLVALSGSVDLV